MWRLSPAMAFALAACGPDDEDEIDLRCSSADLDVTPATGPTPGPCLAVTDEGADGTIDRYERWVYHPLGEPLWIEIGERDQALIRFQFGHDDEGRLIWR